MIRPRKSTTRLAVEPLEDRSVPSYAVVDLGFLPGAWTNSTNDINDLGQIAGFSNPGGPDNRPINRAYAFMPDTPNSATGRMIDLGALPNHVASEGLAISANGWVAGYSFLSQYLEQNPVVWIPDINNGANFTLHQIRDDDPATNDIGRALDVNNAGKVVGFMNGSAYAGRAFVWEQTPTGHVLTDIHDVLPSDAVLQGLGLGNVLVYEALAINDNNQIVANGTVNGDHVSMLLTDDDGWFHNGGVTVTNLGNLGGWIISRAINNQGQIVGEAYLTAARNPGDLRGFLWENGKLRALSKLPKENWSVAYGINDQGDIVGASGRGVSPKAVVWRKGRITDLATQIPKGSGWKLHEALAINTSGQIVGAGDSPHTTFSGVDPSLLDPSTRGYLLTSTALPQLSISDVSVTEGNSGEKTVTLTIVLSSPSNVAVRVDYYTHFYGGARDNVDFVSIPYASRGTITFAPGQTSATLTLTIKGDTVLGDGTDDLGDEFFYVNLINLVNAVFLDAQAKVIILDDDAQR